jgi:hypothetical protein
LHSSDPAVLAAAPETPLSPMQRVVAVFIRPSQAWGGLRTRAQWWIPLLIVLIVSAVSVVLVYDRAIVPMMTSQWEQMVEDGRMSADQMEGAASFMTGPAGKAFTVAQQVVVLFAMQFIIALLIWFGCGFVLGAKLPYRLALEVAAWSSLVTLPNSILTTALGYMRENLADVHTGFGILTATDQPTRLQAGLTTFLDAIGPFAIWYLAVVVIGASTLSGAKRSSVAWVLGAIYLVIAGLMAVGSAMTAAGG